MDALDQEIELKDINSKKYLERALQRGTMLEKRLLQNTDLSNKEMAELVEDLVKKKLGEENAKQDLIDRLNEEKQREIRRNEILSQEKINELNIKKKQMMELETKILKNKAIHQKLKEKGVDFLAELELGNVQDLETVKKNLRYNPNDHRVLFFKKSYLEIKRKFID